MKIVLILAVVILGIWLFRAGRRKDDDAKVETARSANVSVPQDMVRCRHCDVHLPKADSVQGRLGTYCSPEHRQHAET
jgi:uncharacterized protein